MTEGLGFRRDLMHINSVRAGYLDLDGCTIVDMLPRYPFPFKFHSPLVFPSDWTADYAAIATLCPLVLNVPHLSQVPGLFPCEASHR